ncbi:MAG: glycosyltransferase family 1 protein [Ginsengibacter sp.]
MDLICFTHLRWNFVFQRPQHLLTRFARKRRVFYVEEPVFNATQNDYTIQRVPDHPNVFIVVPHLKNDLQEFERNLILKSLIDLLIINENIGSYFTWYYSPMSLSWSDHLNPEMIVYDCMDELSAFKFAPADLKSIEKKLMCLADVVFTGGRSLYEAKKSMHPSIFCFPSSIDKEHFSQARTISQEPEDQEEIPHPRLGFFGVIDERLDILLVNKLSVLRPDWHIVLIGPVVKIDPATLPHRENIHYLGAKDYKVLPAYLSGWDIAILPFAKNESTQFISPTKTPEYMAGGKPVISTSIADVVNPYGINGLVEIADSAEEFISAAEALLTEDLIEKRIQKADLFLANISWDQTYKEMADVLDEILKRKTISVTLKKIQHV